MESNLRETHSKIEPDLEAHVDNLRDRLQALVICLSHSWGGLEQVAANDVLDLGKQGLKVSVLCLEGSPLHEQLVHRKEVRVLPLDFRPRDFFDFKMRSELRKRFSEGANLVHIHQPSLLGSTVPWVWNRPEIAFFASRHIMSDHFKKTFYHRALYSRLDALLVVSQALRQNVLETHALRERQVKVVNLGLDYDRFDPDKVDPFRQRAVWGADPDTVVIGLVGRIDPAKGQATFIKAAAGLTKKLRQAEKLKFVIVGEETLGRTAGYLKQLKQMVNQFGLEKEVVFTGFQENIPEVMRSFDIFVMPSRQEAFGLVAIEAMAMECPILISSGGSASEIVGEEEFGLLMRPEDAFDLQTQLRHMLDSPMERIQMGQRARAHVRKNYDRRFRLARTLDLYGRALTRRGIL